jgi:hypothetical protein
MQNNLSSVNQVKLSKKQSSVITSQPATTPLVQEYSLQINSRFSLRINRAQYDNLLLDNFAKPFKDKKIHKANNKSYRLIVIKLNHNLYNKCQVTTDQYKNLKMEILPEYRNYVSNDVARALRSFFHSLIKFAPYNDCLEPAF